MNIETILTDIWAWATREKNPATIARKQEEVTAVIDRNTKAIKTAVTAELTAIHGAVTNGFNRIPHLTNTGALTTGQAAVLKQAQASVAAALATIEKAFV